MRGGEYGAARQEDKRKTSEEVHGGTEGEHDDGWCVRAGC